MGVFDIFYISRFSVYDQIITKTKIFPLYIYVFLHSFLWYLVTFTRNYTYCVKENV